MDSQRQEKKCSFKICHWGLEFKVKNNKEKKMMEFDGDNDTHVFFPD